MMGGIFARVSGRAAMFCGLSLLPLLLIAGKAFGACDFRAPLTNEASFGAITPAQSGNIVTSITLRYQCTRGDPPAFSVRGANDTGPGLHRMRNLANPAAFLPYRATASVPSPTRYDVTITITEADYRDAWIGAYEDTLFITVAP
ncbi:MAG: hypothetical protein PVH25_05855 [Burkholderiales bacterium]